MLEKWSLLSCKVVLHTLGNAPVVSVGVLGSESFSPIYVPELIESGPGPPRLHAGGPERRDFLVAPGHSIATLRLADGREFRFDFHCSVYDVFEYDSDGAPLYTFEVNTN